MADITDVVNVQISVTSNQIAIENFSLLMILGYNKVFTDLYRSYSQASQLLDDGFLVTSPEYIAASAVFNQNPRPASIYIGRRQADSTTINISNPQPSTLYTCKINATTFSFTSPGTGATAEVIAAGLVAQITPPISGTAFPVTADDNGDGTYTLTATVTMTPYTVTIDANQSITSYTDGQSIVNDITAIQHVINDWYAIMETGRVTQDVLDLSGWCETNQKLYGTISSDTNIINESKSADTTSIPAQLLALHRRYTFCIYRTTLDFIEAGLFGSQLALPPGDATWALKTIAGFAPDNLSYNQSVNALSKQCNTYEQIAGNDVIRNGTVFDNSFVYIDVLRDLDYLISDIEEKEFELLISNPKVPYTQAGIAACQGVLRSCLDNAINMGILANYPAPAISAPLIRNISTADKMARTLNNLNFTATIAGAIQSINIFGTVSY